MTEARLRRLRWAVRLTLTLGVAASVTANILHARPHPVSQAIAAWPPLALLITVELVSRIPLYRKSLGVLRIAATAAIAGIAAWISYWHMAGVVARYGETGTVPYLLPLSVDGLIVVASASLVELSTRHRDTMPRSAPAQAEALAVAVPAVAAEPAASAIVPAMATTPPGTGPGVSGVATAQATGRPAFDEPTDAATGERAPDAPPPGSRFGSDPDDENDAGFEDDEDVDIAPLLAAARDARDEIVREGGTVSRDALARRLRRNGTAIRNDRVSELLAALRREEHPANGSRPKLPI